MAASFEVTGSQQLAALGKRLSVAGDVRLVRRQTLAAIQVSAKEAVPVVRNEARRTLPRSGGLAARVAEQQFGVRTSLAASGGKVSIRGAGMKELRTIDSGTVRHPVWGNRGKWISQSVEPGFFTRPLTDQAPKILAKIVATLDRIAYEMARKPL